VLTEPQDGLLFAPGMSVGLGDSVVGGFANLQEQSVALFQGDIIARRAPLVRRVSRARLEGSFPMTVGGEAGEAQVVPSMALTAAWLHAARGADRTADPRDLARRLDDLCGGTPLSCDGGLDALGLPAIPSGMHNALDINYRGPEGADGMPAVRAVQALRVMGTPALMRLAGVDAPVEVPDELRAVLEDRLVLVGRVDEAADDRFVTPFSFPMLVKADMAGVRVQAQLVDTLLTGRHIRHSGLWLELLLGGALGFSVWRTRTQLTETTHTLVCMTASAGVFVFAAALFRFSDGFVLDLGFPLIATFTMLTIARVMRWSREGYE
jgi:hypothetical protein